MSTALDLTRYTRLSKESFTLVEPTLVIVKEPSFLSYSEDLGLLLCTSCRFFLIALTPRAIREHLNNNHKVYYNANIKGSKDSSIISNLANLSLILLKTLPKQPSNRYYFKDLDLYFNTYLCKVCNYITINQSKFRKHVHNNHDKTLKGKAIDIAYLLANIPIQYLYEPLKLGPFIPKLPNLALLDKPILLSSKVASKEESPSKARTLITKYNKTRERLIKENIFNDIHHEQYPFITNFRFNSYLKDKDISSLLGLIDISYINKPNISKSLENRFNEFLFNRVLIIYENINFFIPGLPSTVKLLLKNSNSLSYTPSYFNKEFKTLKLLSSRRLYSREFSIFLIYLINLYKEESSTLKSTREPTLSSIVKELLAKLLNYNSSRETIFLAKELEEIDILILDIFYNILVTPIVYSTRDSNPLFKNPLLTYFIISIIKPIESTYSYRTSGYIANHANFIIYNSRLTTIGRLRKIETDYLTLDKEYTLEELYNEIYKESIDTITNKVYKEIFNIYKAVKAYNTAKTNTRNPIIDIDLNNLIINSSKVNILDLRDKLFSSLIKKAESLLFNYLLLYKEDSSTPLLDLESLEDNLSYITPNKGLGDLPSFSIYQNRILELVYTRGSSFNSFFYLDNPLNPSELRFNLSKVNLYLKIRGIFIEYLALLTYLLSGSPIRGKETLIIRVLNTLYPRNIYLDIPSKLILINLAYDKVGDNLRLAKENIRFLPPPLSRLYLYYITLILPFYSYLKLNYLSLTKESPYIFETNNKILSTSILSNLLRKEAKKTLNISKLTLSPWRDLILYLINSRIAVDKRDLRVDPFITKGYTSKHVTPIQDILANHSRNTAELHYSRDNTLFSNTKSSIYNRSKELASLYFNYFNLIDIRSISTILKDREGLEKLLSTKDKRLLNSFLIKRKSKGRDLKYLRDSSSLEEEEDLSSSSKSSSSSLILKSLFKKKELATKKTRVKVKDRVLIEESSSLSSVAYSSDSELYKISLDARRDGIKRLGYRAYKKLHRLKNPKSPTRIRKSSKNLSP